MFAFVVLFVFFFSIFLLSVYNTESRNARLFFFFIFLLTLLTTVRPDTLQDYSNYCNFFRYGGDNKFEWGFVYIVDLLRPYAPPIFLFFLFALIAITLKVKFLYCYSPSFILSIAFFLSNSLILHDMIQMRVALAGSFLLWSLLYICKKDIIKFTLLIFAASLFHLSSWVFWPFYFSRSNHINKKLYLSAFLGVYLLHWGGLRIGTLVECIPLFSINRLAEMYKMGMEQGIGTELNVYNFFHLVRCLLLIYLLFNERKVEHLRPMFILSLKIYTMSLLLFVSLSDFPVVAFRISELLQIVEMLLFAYLFMIIKSCQLKKIIPALLAVFFIFINIFYNHLL